MLFVFLLTFFFSHHYPIQAQLTSGFVISSNMWDTTLADCPQLRAATSSFIYENRIYFVGGYWEDSLTGYHYPDEIISYDPGLDSWDTLMDPSPVSRFAVNTIAIGDKVYVLGGIRFADNNSNGLYIYNSLDVLDLKNMKWQSRSSYPGHAVGYAIQLHNYIYAIAGTNAKREPLDECFRYDVENDTWQPIASLNVARYMHQVIVMNDKIYVIGGTNILDNQSQGIRTVEVYDPGTNNWKILAPFPQAGWGYDRFSYRGKIYVTGGRFYQGSTEVVNDTIFMYDPGTDQWHFAGKLPGERYLFHMVRFKDGIYMFGGLNDYLNNTAGKVWKLDLTLLHKKCQAPAFHSFYPNPARDRITIDGFPGSTFRIFNIGGHCIYKGTLQEQRSTLSLDHLARGVYVIQFQTNDQLFSSKLILQ